MLAASHLTDREKAALYSEIIGDGRDEEFDTLLRAGLSWQDIMEAYNRYVSLNKEEGRKAGEKATEYAHWVDKSRHTSKQKALIKENFTFYAQIPADADRYGKLMDAGLSDDDAYKLANALAELTPEPGKKQVSDYQRYEAIIGSVFFARTA